MSRKEVLKDGTELHYTEDGKPWFWVPPQQVEALKKLDEEYQKLLAKIIWGRK